LRDALAGCVSLVYLKLGKQDIGLVVNLSGAGVHTYTRAIGLLDEIKRLLTGAKDDAETHAEGGEPVATPPGEEERETSTNAQMMGSSDEPWSGND
jgi:hypothetical protein